MKTSLLRHVCGSALGSGRPSIALLGLVLVGALGLASAGGDLPATNGMGEGGPGAGNSGNFGGGGDDETIGTLPTYHGGPTFQLMRHARSARPLLYVQGTVNEVLSSAVVVRGDTRVLAQPMPGGNLRLVFLGDTQVSFDRNAFHAASLRVGVAIPDGSPILRSSAVWNGQSLGGFWSYVYELPIAQFEANGLLDQAPVFAGVLTKSGSTSVRAHASFDFVTLTQRR